MVLILKDIDLVEGLNVEKAYGGKIFKLQLVKQ